MFKIVVGNFESVLNKHAPLKELSRTEMKFRNKPWLTKKLGILSKPKIRYVKKAKKRNSPESFQRYKIYRSSLIHVKEKSKNCITTIYLKHTKPKQKGFGKELVIN